jgi:hypothetical protein
MISVDPMRHCERSEAIQPLKQLDCFVALTLLAMTAPISR